MVSLFARVTHTRTHLNTTFLRVVLDVLMNCRAATLRRAFLGVSAPREPGRSRSEHPYLFTPIFVPYAPGEVPTA